MGHLKTTHFQICFLIQYMKYFLSKSTLACLSLIMLPQGMASATEEESIASFLQNHCVKCHGEEKQKGDLRLDQLDVQISEHASVSAWQDVLDMLNTGEMPPEDETQPPKEELTSFIGAITDNITSAHKRLADTGGKISMRHLTKREYLGSMEDLFGIELPRNLLPDDVSGEFDTIGSDQFFSLKQYENFYKAGKAVVGKNLLAITSPLLEQKTLRHDPEIAPAEAAKAAYEKMITVKEMLEAGAPYSEIAKIDPKVADEGQGKLFISRYPKRSVKPIANYEKTKGKKGVTGSFNYSTESRPRSVYKLKLFALEASEGGLKIRVNGKAAGEVKFQSDQTRVSSYMMPSQSVLSSMGITIPVHALAISPPPGPPIPSLKAKTIPSSMMVSLPERECSSAQPLVDPKHAKESSLRPCLNFPPREIPPQVSFKNSSTSSRARISANSKSITQNRPRCASYVIFRTKGSS